MFRRRMKFALSRVSFSYICLSLRFNSFLGCQENDQLMYKPSNEIQRSER